MADKGRARKGKRTTIGGQFAWRLIEMQEAPAFRALSLSGHRVLARLEIEVGRHGGNDNGKLPTTFDQFEKAATDAVAAGYLGVSLAAKDAGTPFLLQELQNAYGNAPEINDWIYQRPDATFDQPGMLAAAQKLQEWTKNGVISPDATSVDYPTMMADFQAGKALYVPVGDWENARMTAAMGDNVGFFLIPPGDSGAKQ